jgi:hypothetical protein
MWFVYELSGAWFPDAVNDLPQMHQNIIVLVFIWEQQGSVFALCATLNGPYHSTNCSSNPPAHQLLE